MRKHLFAMLVFTGIGGSLLFGIAPHLLGIYVGHAPLSPDPATGHVYSFNQHGVTVYLSTQEQTTYGGLSALGLVFLALAAATYKRWKDELADVATDS